VTIPLEGVTTLGRSLSADVRMDDLTVSREHARIRRTGTGSYIIEDLGSGNGTFVNGNAIVSELLKDGDEITIGNNKFTFQGAYKSPSTVAADKTMLEISGVEGETSVVNAIDASSTITEHALTPEVTIEHLYNMNRRLKTILEIFSSIGGNLDEEQILPKILDKLFDVYPETQRGFIILRDPDTGKLTPRAVKTLDSSAETKLELSETILQYVLEKKQAVWSRDALSDSRFEGSESILDFQMRSVMCAPLMYEGEVLGFISLDTNRIAPSYDEDGLALLAGIANQASLAIASARMHGQLMRQERLEQDMRNASRIQHSFLPQAPPQVEGYEFVDWYDTAQEVGGDFYDFIPLPDDKMVIIIGDVSGKGIPAALMMAKMTGHARFYAAHGYSPSKIAEELNKTLAAGNTEIFVTALVLHLDCRRNEMQMVNAGHPPPLLKKADGSVEQVKGETGFPFGVIDDVEFPEATYVLQPNERLCLFTDGISEAMNENKEPFGNERLEKVLRESPNSASEIVSNIQKAIERHTGSAIQSDDLTLVCFGPLGPGE